CNGLGIFPSLVPSLHNVKDLSSEVAISIGCHSKTALVCVAFRNDKTGTAGLFEANAVRMVSCRARNLECTRASCSGFWETDKSMIEPAVTVLGSRIEGNSI